MIDNRNNESRSFHCPSWCIDQGTCRGDHSAEAFGTTATGGLPPHVDSPEAPRHNIVVVRAQWPEVEGLPPGVALFGVHHDRDFQVDLTVREAGVLLAGLTAAIATADAD